VGGRFSGSAIRGDETAALPCLSPESEATVLWDETFSLALAQCLALINQPEQALKWIRNAIDRGFLHYPFLSSIEPFLQKRSSNPG